MVYEHQNYGGRSRPLPVNSHRFYNVEFNDMISSIKVPAGFVAIVFEHADDYGGYGISVDLLEDCPDLSKYDFNDKISYITVFAVPGGTGCRWIRNSNVNGQFSEGRWGPLMIFADGLRETVTVSPPIPPNTPERIVIDNNDPDPAKALINALAKDNRTVYGKRIPIVVEFCRDIDLTEYSFIKVGSDHSLVASPSCVRGPRSQGPRLYITQNRPETQPLFEIRGDNVLFSGFRLEGPSRTSQQGANRERGILVAPDGCVQTVCGCLPEPIRNIEISNLELAFWSGAAITVNDNTEYAERGRLFNTNESGVRIRNNYIHHNLHGAGWGYGVDVGNGGYALIEQNVFDANRHAIAGESSDGKKDFSGYTARDNLILAAGGQHCSESRFLPCYQTHQIDMHGDGHEPHNNNNFLCGTAGETMIIQRNTITYTEGYAIKIRGNPADKVVVDNNVFRHKNSGNAIDQEGACGGFYGLLGDNITKPIDLRPNNIYNPPNTLTSYGKIDLVGDGVLEELMATGVTWWAWSTVTGQWRYLNTMPETLDKLVFGDYDHDGKADDIAIRPRVVTVAPRKYTKDGKGEWIPVNEVIRNN